MLKKQKKFNGAMPRAVFRAATVLVFVGCAAAVAAGGTFAYFSGDVTVHAVQISTGSVAVAVANATTSPSLFAPGTFSHIMFDVMNNGTLPTQYVVRADVASSTGNELCEALRVVAVNDNPWGAATATLASFASDPAAMASSSDHWDVTVILPQDANQNPALQNEHCLVSFAVTAWQSVFPDASQGFSHGINLGVPIMSGSWEQGSNVGFEASTQDAPSADITTTTVSTIDSATTSVATSTPGTDSQPLLSNEADLTPVTSSTDAGTPPASTGTILLPPDGVASETPSPMPPAGN